MKTVSAMEVRRSFGAILDDVRLKSETYILERAGKAVAMLSPIRAEQTASEGIQLKLRAIQELSGIHSMSKRGKNVSRWLKKERNEWERDK